jgi:hypothetical protein
MRALGFMLQPNLRSKSVEYRLLMKTGTHALMQKAKVEINNQSLITGFSVKTQI